MNAQTAALTTTTAAVGVTLVSIMVPNAIDARPVNDEAVEKGYAAALVSTVVLGFAVSLMDGSPAPLVGATVCALVVVMAHRSIARNGLGLMV